MQAATLLVREVEMEEMLLEAYSMEDDPFFPEEIAVIQGTIQVSL